MVQKTSVYRETLEDGVYLILNVVLKHEVKLTLRNHDEVQNVQGMIYIGYEVIILSRVDINIG